MSLNKCSKIIISILFIFSNTLYGDINKVLNNNKITQQLTSQEISQKKEKQEPKPTEVEEKKSNSFQDSKKNITKKSSADLEELEEKKEVPAKEVVKNCLCGYL